MWSLAAFLVLGLPRSQQHPRPEVEAYLCPTDAGLRREPPEFRDTPTPLHGQKSIVPKGLRVTPQAQQQPQATVERRVAVQVAEEDPHAGHAPGFAQVLEDAAVRQVMSHLRSNHQIKTPIAKRQGDRRAGHIHPRLVQAERPNVEVQVGEAPPPTALPGRLSQHFPQRTIARPEVEDRKGLAGVRSEPLGQRLLKRLREDEETIYAV